MASFEKYSAVKAGVLLKHNNRMPNDNTAHSNQKIDSNRTIENYHLKKGDISTLHNRLDEVFSMGRSDQIVLVEICLSLPKDVHIDDERAFFRGAFNFFCDDFGANNIINAVVHKDESTPHLHLDFIPVVTREVEYSTNHNKSLLAEWKAAHAERLRALEEEHGAPVVERLCCKELITKQYLESMHERLDRYISEEIGYSCGIINGATVNGNKKILELKTDTLKKETEILQKQKDCLEKEISTILAVAQRSGVSKGDIGLLPLMQRIADLERQNTIYRNIISAQRYSFSQKELEQLRVHSYFPAMSANVNCFDGKLDNFEIEDNAIVLIEIYDRERRFLPQRRYIDKDDDLRNQTNLALRMNNGASLFIRSSRTSDRSFVFIRTDNAKQTYLALLDFEQRLRQQEEEWKSRKIYLERLSYDDYDLARSILERAPFESIYLTGREREEPNSKEISIQKG